MHPVKILLVDDDEEDFIITREILSGGPGGDMYQLYWCNRYEAAINSMLKGHYDIYLVDYRLGRHSGLDLLREAIKSNCLDPLIILTGKGDRKTDEEALMLGAADYLTKAEINFDTLTRAIRYALRHHNTIGQLKTSESKFRVLFERSKDPVIITDSTGTVYDANGSILSFLDTTFEELKKKNIISFFADPGDIEHFISQIQRYGVVKDLELEIVTSRGRRKHCRVWSFIQILQHGNSELYYTIIHETEKSTNEIKIPDDFAESFTRLMAEEVYTPLSSINFATEELLNNLDKQNPELISIINKNCERIRTITSSLISASRKHGKQKV
ncbi:response regulator [Pararcticibacter amylolyticus]|uniref:Response regulatory domain-containing protein n=1 Tax=Pararcticibacter amylolyticus TaxID=2173175 RepID=A0A2U2PMG9_9SPHI|nr:response regulator [Pararcticibacter amylolyticus]PWG82518.1 hypothetical protein DDR33_01230 [Pararcticibacter amylolyticus]